ncbi:MAG TPA: hypoxanthine phosphoribosyltransferase [Actinomycetota bacterium]
MAVQAEVVFAEQEIRERVRELGAEITRDYRGRTPVLVSVLKGGTMFLADLFREIDLPLRVDFMSISAYGGGDGPSGVVRILKDLDHDVLGEDVLVVEDIIDTGLTLSYLLSSLANRQPASLEVCTLLDRSVRRIAPIDIRYRGFDCPDRFVVGYGLDYQERYRQLPFILSVDPAELAEDLDGLVAYLDEPVA